jgi:hypothetical protein
MVRDAASRLLTMRITDLILRRRVSAVSKDGAGLFIRGDSRNPLISLCVKQLTLIWRAVC